jgi:hypothetical protein
VTTTEVCSFKTSLVAKEEHHEEKPQTPKKDPSYEELPTADSFMRSLIRYMELQPKDGG